MAEFIMKSGLAGDISSFQNAGGSLTSGISGVKGGGLDSLKTSVKYVEEHKAIMDLLALYQKLVEKDAADLRNMMQSTQNLDTSLGNTMR